MAILEASGHAHMTSEAQDKAKAEIKTKPPEVPEEYRMKEDGKEVDEAPKEKPKWYRQKDWLAAEVDLGPWGIATIEDPAEIPLQRWQKTSAKFFGKEDDEQALVDTAVNEPDWINVYLATYIAKVEGPQNIEFKRYDLKDWEKVLGVMPTKVVARLRVAIDFYTGDKDTEPEGNF